MKLLLYGGSFDPPHLGHMQLLQNATQLLRPQKVVVMPAGYPPHKATAQAPPKWRLAMCACFYEVFDKVEISDWELCRQGRSYTLHTVQFLLKEYPKAEIYLSIGDDALLQFHTWYAYQTLLSKVVLLVQTRKEPPSQVKQAIERLEKEGARVMVCTGKTEAVSSTQLRLALLRHEDITLYVAPLVAKIIQTQGLYRF